MVASILTGVGRGLWAALWLDQWWANVLTGVIAGLVYSYFALPSGIWTGMLKPTQAGALEIGQWLSLEEALARTGSMGVRDPSDAMLPYAVALGVAQPWLNVAASAPPWFGLRGEPSVRGADLDSAYRAFMHAREWHLTGRSDDAAKAAAEWDYKEEIELLRLEDLNRLGRESPDAGKARNRETTDEIEAIARELESRQSSQEGSQSLPSSVYRPYRGDRPVEETKSGGGLRGCFSWVVGLGVIGVVALGVLLSLDIIPPRDKPCPLNSLTIPTAAQIAVAGDLFRDVCVKVSGAVIFQDIDELIIEMDRGDYTQQVNVRHPSGLFKTPVPPGVPIALAGWLKVEEDGTYVVHFVPHHESDRGWWQNLRDNIAGLF